MRLYAFGMNAERRSPIKWEGFGAMSAVIIMRLIYKAAFYE